MRPKEKILTSFTTQLTLWVASFVLVISCIVIFLLGRYSQNVIHGETVDAVRQLLANAALQCDNRMRQAEISAHYGKLTLTTDRDMIEQLVEQNRYVSTFQQLVPNAVLKVVESQGASASDDNYTFYRPIGQRTWGLQITCPKSDISAKYWRMWSILLFWGGVGFAVLFVILYTVVARHLRPLHLLADMAQNIADGNATPIPDVHQEHESGRLQTSLKKMQLSLNAYMDEMQRKQAKLSEQNAELKAAYGEAQAYEDMKARFLTDMTAQMAEPVEKLCQCSEAICRDYNTMTKADMARRQMDIMQSTETLTRLLDLLTHNTSENLVVMNKNTRQ